MVYECVYGSNGPLDYIIQLFMYEVSSPSFIIQLFKFKIIFLSFKMNYAFMYHGLNDCRTFVYIIAHDLEEDYSCVHLAD